MPLLPAEQTERLRTYANPTYGYRRGADGEVEKDLFDGAIPPGWADNPADVDDVTASEPASEPVDVDGERPDFMAMDKDELEAYAREALGLEIDKRRRIDNLVEQVSDAYAAAHEAGA